MYVHICHEMLIHVASGADPDFLGWGFICKKVCGIRFADIIYFLLNIA